MKIQEIVNDPEWQIIRRSFLGTWKHTPAANCQILRTYLQDFSDPLRVRRVLNYLTGSAFRFGRIRHLEIDRLLLEIRERKQHEKETSSTL
jgi:hypothetical protein